MNRKLVSFILQVGTVVMTTVFSFVVTPPELVPDENSGLNWKNVFTFIAGVLSIVLADRYKSPGKKKSLPLWLAGTLVVLLVAYEISYNKFSISCYNHYRIVVSGAPVKAEHKAFFDANFAHKPKPVEEFLQLYSCVSTEVWQASDLYPSYYGMIALYLAIILCVILLLVSLSTLIKKDYQPIPKPDE